MPQFANPEEDHQENACVLPPTGCISSDPMLTQHGICLEIRRYQLIRPTDLDISAEWLERRGVKLVPGPDLAVSRVFSASTCSFQLSGYRREHTQIQSSSPKYKRSVPVQVQGTNTTHKISDSVNDFSFPTTRKIFRSIVTARQGLPLTWDNRGRTARTLGTTHGGQAGMFYSTQAAPHPPVGVTVTCGQCRCCVLTLILAGRWAGVYRVPPAGQR
ncbi:hypothetical protein Bbelb_237840 [Branchiostoma belcheri]|nr:hypothetical protein Bbelb_237840 [Branchiostoma belcheri]